MKVKFYCTIYKEVEDYVIKVWLCYKNIMIIIYFPCGIVCYFLPLYGTAHSSLEVVNQSGYSFA